MANQIWQFCYSYDYNDNDDDLKNYKDNSDNLLQLVQN